MYLFLKILLTAAVIIAVTAVGKKMPSLAGLIATMPVIALLAMVWLHAEKPAASDNAAHMEEFARGAFWGMLPSLLFYGAAYACFRKGLGFPATMGISFAVWTAGAAVHQWLLGR